jgi:hypothetical protein
MQISTRLMTNIHQNNPEILGIDTSSAQGQSVFGLAMNHTKYYYGCLQSLDIQLKNNTNRHLVSIEITILRNFN